MGASRATPVLAGLACAVAIALASCGRGQPDRVAAAPPPPPAQPAQSPEDLLTACSDFGREEAARLASCTALIQTPGAASDLRAKAFNNRGVMRFQSGDKDGAMTDYNEALRLDAQYPAAFYNRSHLWRALGDAARADADYAEAVRLDPGLKGH